MPFTSPGKFIRFLVAHPFLTSFFFNHKNEQQVKYFELYESQMKIFPHYSTLDSETWKIFFEARRTFLRIKLAALHASLEVIYLNGTSLGKYSIYPQIKKIQEQLKETKHKRLLIMDTAVLVDLLKRRKIRKKYYRNITKRI